MSSHADGSLYQPAFDFPQAPDGPRTDYMIASVPRTGSTYFTAMLWREGRLGAPLEYLNPHINRKRFDEFALDLDGYWNEIRSRRTSPNGVFGWKMFIGTYEHLAVAHPDFLPRISPAHVIYFDREDTCAQAVSYWRAMYTRSWFKDAPEAREPVYDFEAIRDAHILAENQRQAWEHIFRMTGVEPLRITYERFLARPTETIRQVAAHIGVSLETEPDVGRIPLPSVQRNSLTLSWATRFRSEAGLQSC